MSVEEIERKRAQNAARPPGRKWTLRRLLASHEALREQLHEAHGAIAHLRNSRDGVNASSCCLGDFEKCWCDDCEKRRLLVAAGLEADPHAVFDLSLAQVKEWIAQERARKEDR
jgi:hypothetical protein